jgi:putative transposase
MLNLLILLFSSFLAGFRSRLALQTEILALRHPIVVLKRSVNRPRLRTRDRFLWIWPVRLWPQWRLALVIVKPETVLAWHRKGFRLCYLTSNGRMDRSATSPRFSL